MLMIRSRGHGLQKVNYKDCTATNNYVAIVLKLCAIFPCRYVYNIIMQLKQLHVQPPNNVIVDVRQLQSKMVRGVTINLWGH